MASVLTLAWAARTLSASRGEKRWQWAGNGCKVPVVENSKDTGKAKGSRRSVATGGGIHVFLSMQLELVVNTGPEQGKGLELGHEQGCGRSTAHPLSTFVFEASSSSLRSDGPIGYCLESDETTRRQDEERPQLDSVCPWVMEIKDARTTLNHESGNVTRRVMESKGGKVQIQQSIRNKKKADKKRTRFYGVHLFFYSSYPREKERRGRRHDRD